MKYLYSLLFFIIIQSAVGQKHISEIGIPVDGLESATLIMEDQPQQMLATPSLVEENVSISDFTGPIIVRESDYQGASKGQFAVSLSGAATYNFPIDVPPGINGITPGIGVGYNSHAGNGIAGYGWNISGLSTISIVGSNKFFDGKNTLANYSSDDRFVLDGQRLVLKSGIYGKDGAEYQTETYSNLKITSHGVNGTTSAPEYFKVAYPDGTIAYYGRAYSGLAGGSTRTNTTYAITYTTNPQNVIVKYTYINDNGNLLISGISYGFRSSSPLNGIQLANTTNIISFTYKNRNRAENNYTYSDDLSKITKILDKINVKGFAENYRSYQFTYKITSLGYEQLQKITETSGDGSISKSPVTFGYGSDPTQNLVQEQPSANLSSAVSSLSQINSFNTKAIPGDYSGSGKLGYLIYHTTINDGDKQETKGDVLRIFDPGNSKLTSRTFSQHFNEVVPTKVLNHNNILLPNQGFTTITRNGSTPVNNKLPYRFDSFIFMPEYIGEMALISSKTFNLINYGDVRDYYSSGDVNGDGVTDVIRMQHPKNFKLTHDDFGDQSKTNIEVIDLKGNIVHVTENIPIGFNYQIADVDKDGYDDLIIMRHKSILIYRFNQVTKKFENHQGTAAPQLHYNMYNKKPVYTGDFNGDGFLDLVSPKAEGSSIWVFYMNMGSMSVGNIKLIEVDTGIIYNENSIKSNTDPFKPFKHHDIYNYIFTDINNDGKTDIIKTYDYFRIKKNSTTDYDNTSQMWFSENMNFDPVLSTANFSATHHVLSSPNRQYPIYTVSSHNQKDYKTEFGIITDNILRTIKYNRNNVLTNHLKTIDELDITTKIIYDSYDEKKVKINSENPAENDGEDAVLPFISFDQPMSIYPKQDVDVAPGFYVVKKVTYNSEKGLLTTGNSLRKQLFSYADATVNNNGKGFLGFKGRMVTNAYRGGPYITNLKDQIKNVTVFDLDNNGLVKEEYVAHSTDWANFFMPPVNYITKKINTNSVNILPNKVFKAQTTKSVINEGLTGVQRTINTTYDAYSNPLSITENVTGAGATSSLNTVFTYVNSLLNDNYYIGRATSKTISTNNNQTSKEAYNYTNDLLSSITKWGATNSTPISETNEYDLYGNVVKKIVSASDIQPRIATYVYDSTGRYIEKSTDTEGLQTSYVYNKNKGWLLSKTNPYGLSRSFGYNALGMITSETDYLGNTTNFTYKTGSLGLGDFYMRHETNYPDGRKERKTTNGWGNTTVEGVSDIEGNWINTLYNYDSQDRLIKKSEPYTSSATLYTTFEYDQYGRVTKSILPTGREITSSYNGLSTSVDDGVKIKTEVKNINNQISKVVDNGETINYTYNSNGTLNNSNYDGTVINFEYDDWGRKSKITDPSAGTYTYEYNSIGDLLKETTPNGTTTHTYDSTGKVLSTTNPDNTINYTYSADKLLEKIVSVSSQGTDETNFLYDAYKRLAEKQYTMSSGMFYGYSYSFDSFGRSNQENKIVFVSGNNSLQVLSTKNIYKNGYLWKVQNADNNTDLKVYNTFNERGQVTNFSLGNGVTTNHTYDQYGYLTQNSVNKTGGSLFNLNNTWDVQRGNLKHRSSTLFYGLFNEHFTYDNYDRLTNIEARIVNSTAYPPGNEQIQYDNKGRISKSKVGDYTYNSSKAYQLQNIENLNDLQYYQNNPLQEVTYNVTKAPLTIKQAGKENIYFTYDGFNNRTAMYYGNEAADQNASSKVRYYSPVGDIEVDFNKATNKYVVNIYVDGDAYSSSIIQRTENNLPAFYYLHRDYLGSILAVTNSAGNIVEKRHFDAWGNVLFVQDGQNNNLTGLTFLDRGYTGHEHLKGVGLINMNARLYDPKLHRFLAPDSIIQDPGNPQNYNLYGYVYNNPLRFTDPSGNYAVVDDIVAAIIGGFVNLGVNIYQGNIKGSFWEIIGKGSAAFGSGAVSGTLALYGPAGWAAGGAIVGGTNAWLSGQDVTEGAVFGGITGVVGGALGSYISSGISVAIQGISITNPVIKSAVVGSLGSGLTGGVMNFGIVGIQTGSFSQAIDAFSSGFSMAFVTGAVTSSSASYAKVIQARSSVPSGSGRVDDAMAPAMKSLNQQVDKIGKDYQQTLVQEKMANARALGVFGEQTVGVGSKTRIPSLTGTAKYRIPDQLTETVLGEVKNVKHLNYTRQLKDFSMYSQQMGLEFILYTRPNTTFSSPLQQQINTGQITVKPIIFN